MCVKRQDTPQFLFFNYTHLDKLLINSLGSVAKNLAPLQNQKKSSQLGNLIIFIRKKMAHKGKNYSVKMQKYYFCNGTLSLIFHCAFPTLQIWDVAAEIP